MAIMASQQERSTLCATNNDLSGLEPAVGQEQGRQTESQRRTSPSRTFCWDPAPETGRTLKKSAMNCA